MGVKEMASNKNDLDIIEETIGAIGRWQIIMAFLISLMRLHISWHQLGIVFLAPEPSFQCSDKNITDECSPNCPSHEFDTSMFTDTIISEWDLVCDRKFYLNNVLQPLIMAGSLFGSILFGYLSDRFGRKYSLISASLLEVVFGVGAAFVPWFEAFIVLKFLTSICIGGILLVSFIIAMELIGKSSRNSVGTLLHFPYFIGYAFMGVLGYLIRDWHYFQLTISVTNVIFITYIWIIPESPRWLLLVGGTDKAIAILQNAAKFNKLSTYDIREKVLLHQKQTEGNHTEAGNFLDLIRTYEMRIRTICICIVTFFVFMSFFGVSQYLGQLGDSMFINVGISGLIQIPASILAICLMNKYGRKITLILSNILGGVCCLLIITVPSDLEWVISLLGAIGIMFTGNSVTVCYIYTGELYPTIIRSVGMGTAAMCGKFGATVAPYFLDLKGTYFWLPPLILGVCSVLGGLVCIRLPETFNMKLPETIEEAEGLSRKKNDVMISVIK